MATYCNGSVDKRRQERKGGQGLFPSDTNQTPPVIRVYYGEDEDNNAPYIHSAPFGEFADKHLMQFIVNDDLCIAGYDDYSRFLANPELSK